MKFPVKWAHPADPEPPFVSMLRAWKREDPRPHTERDETLRAYDNGEKLTMLRKRLFSLPRKRPRRQKTVDREKMLAGALIHLASNGLDVRSFRRAAEHLRLVAPKLRCKVRDLRRAWKEMGSQCTMQLRACAAGEYREPWQSKKEAAQSKKEAAATLKRLPKVSQ